MPFDRLFFFIPGTTMHPLIRYCLAIASLSAFTAATTHAAPDPSANYEVVDECFTEIDIDLDHECGYVTVPEFHDGRSDRVLRLAVVRIFATDESEAGAPVFFVDGGPGASMEGLLTVNIGNIKLNQTRPGDAGTPVLDMLARHDFVMLSQRGAAFAEPAVLTCPEGEDSDLMGVLQNLTPKEKSELTQSLYEGCLADWGARGVDLNAYNGYEMADDIDAVRRALGYDKVIYFGVSFGAQLGQFVMKRHPEILEAAIFDGANALSKTEWEQDNGVALERAVRQILALCAADAKCSASHENPEGLLDTAISKLEEEPMVISYYSDAGSADVTVELGLAELGVVLSHMMGRTAGFIPTMLAETVDGTGRLLAEEFIASYVASRDNDDFPLLMHLAVVCSDDPPQKDVGFDQSGESDFAVAMERVNASWYADSCEAVDVHPLPPGSDEDVEATVPTLLFSGALDVRTPPSRNREVADNLSNARVVTFKFGLHGQYNVNRMCVASIMSQFIDDPSSLDALDTSCVDQQSSPLVFITLEDLGVTFEDE